VQADEDELKKHAYLLNTLVEKAGRLILNGVPTGVEVCAAMMHGGPYPATTDSRFTAVGRDAIRRFARPVAFQNFTDALLPPELQEANPLNIWRMRNNQWGKH
jgi:NADP-dependent aldehyde dehydrogenase